VLVHRVSPSCLKGEQAIRGSVPVDEHASCHLDPSLSRGARGK
jgi:hypothetical protein